MSELGRGTELIHNALIALELRMLELRARLAHRAAHEGSAEGLRSLLRSALRELGESLYEGAMSIFEAEHGKRPPEPSFYFWPGYDSVSIESDPRVSLPVPDCVQAELYRRGLDIVGLSRGVLFPEKAETDVGLERITRSALYFHFALSPALESSERAPAFTVGGTHAWLTHGPPLMTGRDEKAHAPLEAIEVSVSGGQATEDGIVRISLPQCDPVNWGRTIAQCLNDQTILMDYPSVLELDDSNQASRIWPLPASLPEEGKARYFARLCDAAKGKDSNPPGASQNVRELLYSLWLVACFKPRQDCLAAAKGIALALGADLPLLDPFRLQQVERLIELEEGEGLKEVLRNTTFSYWTSLAIPQPIGLKPEEGPDTATGASADLGSAMFLSTFQLSTSFLRAARLWVYSFYLSLRALESRMLAAAKASERTRTATEKALRSQHSHAIGTEMTFLKFLAQKSLTPLASLESQEEYENLQRALSYPGATQELLAAFSGAEPAEAALVLGANEPREETEKRILALLCEEHLGPVPFATVRSLTLRVVEAILSQQSSALSEPYRVLAFLVQEIGDLRDENRALQRLESSESWSAVTTTPVERSTSIKIELQQAWLRALTVFLERAFPAHSGSYGASDLLSFATTLFGSESRGRDFARRLRSGLRTDPVSRLLSVSESLLAELPVDLAWYEEGGPFLLVPFDPSRAPDPVGLMVFRMWAREVFLNALKAVSRSRSEVESPTITVSLRATRHEVPQVAETFTLEVRNSATLEDVRLLQSLDGEIGQAGAGRYGLVFIGQAKRFLVGSLVTLRAQVGGEPSVTLRIEAPIQEGHS